MTAGRVLLAAILAVGGLSAGQAGSSEHATAESGIRLFEDYCSACHQYDDAGMGEAPPLDGSPWVVGPARRIVLIILHGVEGPIQIGGRVYDREMPGFGVSLSDQEVSDLATYTRRRFGADDPAVSTSEVARIRSETAGRTSYWSAEELLEIR